NVADAKVGFTYSMLFDEYDLNGVKEIGLERCMNGGCSVFVSASDRAMESTKNIFVCNEDKSQNYSLYDYASGYDKTTGKMTGLHLSGTGYTIQNANVGNIGPIAIYNVASQAPLYNNASLELFDGTRMNRPNHAMSYVTIVTPDPYDLFIQAEGSNFLQAYVRATGFDNNYQRQPNPDECQILIDQSGNDPIRLHINSPIITVSFDGNYATQICTKPNTNNMALLDYNGIATSQGYVGCKNNNYQVFRSSAYTSSLFDLHDSLNVEKDIDLDYTVTTKNTDQVKFTIFSNSGTHRQSQCATPNFFYQNSAIGQKINIELTNAYSLSYLVKYSPHTTGSIPTGEGICPNFVPTTTMTVSQTTLTITSTTSGS
ncbi:hypothetical protein PENTCL1PPCAC_22287, partial [Pristionchus entomophagus]